MHLSPDARRIVQEMQDLREQREYELQRDLEFIDAEYDRRLRRVATAAIWNRSSCVCHTSRPLTLRRFCSRRLRWIRRKLRAK